MKTFSFGKYLLSVDGTEQLTSFLPVKWEHHNDTQSEKQRIAVLSISEDVSLEKMQYGDGWHELPLEGKRQVIYSRNGKTLFSLIYSLGNNDITVLVNRLQKEYAKLGAQYGMMMALYRQCIGLHGVTLLCGNEIIVLSAPSGTGKTTLAQLLEKFCDAIIINGDFALLSLEDNSVFFEPTPFCGSSGRALNHRVRIDRVVFLNQSKTNDWQELTGREAIMKFMDNAFLPTWDKSLQRMVQENILKCVSAVKVDSYGFAPTQRAAEVFLKHVERIVFPLCSE